MLLRSTKSSQVLVLWPQVFQGPVKQTKKSHTSCADACVWRWETSNQNVPKINNLKNSIETSAAPQRTLYTHCEPATKCPKIPCRASPAEFSTPWESQSINDKKLPCNVAVLQSYHFKIVGFLGGWESPSSWLISLLFNQPSESI